jgi:hypothetical protein
MSEEQASHRPAFSPRTVLALVLVGVVSLAGLAVLSAYAPDLRGGQDGRAHALSKSAVGYAGAAILLKAAGAPVVVSRTRPSRPAESVVILTPEAGLSPRQLQGYPKGRLTLIVLPKWRTTHDPIRRGFVRKAGVMEGRRGLTPLLASYASKTIVSYGPGRARPVLHGVAGPFADIRALRPGTVDRLGTIGGEGWTPLLVDDQGRAVLVRSTKTPSVWVLAEPDLLNNQGLASRDTARVAMTILQAAREGERPLLFDVTLNGYERGRGLGRLMLEPPWLAATLIAVAAGVLMGLHALARFGQPRRRGRAVALGARALVDNSADLIRAARKEHELAADYAALTRSVVLRGAGGHAAEAGWLDELAARRGVAAPGDLTAEADAAASRDDLLAVARKLYEWRGEMLRERR